MSNVADRKKAYNAYRLEQAFGGMWSKYAGYEEDGVMYQDHYMTLSDGSVWRPRVPHHYYDRAIGKLMMIYSPGGPQAHITAYKTKHSARSRAYSKRRT